MLTHGSLLANARQMLGWFPEASAGQGNILGVLPFFHVYGDTLVLDAGLLLGEPRCLYHDHRPPKSWRPSDASIRRSFPGVPTLYVGIVNDERSKKYDLSSINICVSGGAPLPPSLNATLRR